MRPIQTRFRLASVIWLKLAIPNNSLDRSTKSTPSPRRAPTPCTHTISGSISLPSRGSFNLSLAVLVHYRSCNIFSLGGWTPQIQSRFHVSRPTRQPNLLPKHDKSQFESKLFANIRLMKLGVPGYHRLWRSFPTASARLINFWPYARHW